MLLVGGSTRTPLITDLLSQRTGLEPRQDVHPDLCVALGAGVMASRLAGRNVDRVLVDVSPYSFGVSFLGERGGFPYPHCFKPIIRRNTPLPLTRTEQFITSRPFQTEVDVQIFQGDDEDALRNVLVGDFRITQLSAIPGGNDILCKMRLDLDGMLEVTAVEKTTGKSKQITIANSMQTKSAEEIAAARQRLQELFASRETTVERDFEGQETLIEAEAVALPELTADPLAGESEALDLVTRSRNLLEKMHAEDREEAIDLHEKIEMAIEAGDESALSEASRVLRELLFFMEGRPN